MLWGAVLLSRAAWATVEPCTFELEDAVVRETPMGRLGVPEDIAAAAVWLASDECFMTGVTLPLAGGNELRRIPTIEEMMN